MNHLRTATLRSSSDSASAMAEKSSGRSHQYAKYNHEVQKEVVGSRGRYCTWELGQRDWRKNERGSSERREVSRDGRNPMCSIAAIGSDIKQWVRERCVSDDVMCEVESWTYDLTKAVQLFFCAAGTACRGGRATVRTYSFR